MLSVLASLEQDWVDYADLAVGALGALAAVVALIVALRSAKDARASAEAAEASAFASLEVADVAKQELALTRRQVEAAEAERERRPELRLSLATEPHPLPEGDRQVVLTVTMHNVGTRTAEDAELRVGIADKGATIESVRTPYGADPTPLPEDTGFAALGDGQAFSGWTFVREMHTIPVGAAIPRHFLVSGQTGAFPIAVRLFHADAPDQGVERRAKLNLNWHHDRPILIESPG